MAVACAGCHTWKAAPLAAGQVVRRTGEGFEFDSARVSRDTLFGRPRHGAADSTVAIPVRRLLRVQRREFSEDRSVSAWARLSLVPGVVLLAACFIALGRQ
jgi:hypothetical protein